MKTEEIPKLPYDATIEVIRPLLKQSKKVCLKHALAAMTIELSDWNVYQDGITQSPRPLCITAIIRFSDGLLLQLGMQADDIADNFIKRCNNPKLRYLHGDSSGIIMTRSGDKLSEVLGNLLISFSTDCCGALVSALNDRQRVSEQVDRHYWKAFDS